MGDGDVVAVSKSRDSPLQKRMSLRSRRSAKEINAPSAWGVDSWRFTLYPAINAVVDASGSSCMIGLMTNNKNGVGNGLHLLL